MISQETFYANIELDKSKTKEYLIFLRDYASDLIVKTDGFDDSLKLLLNEFSLFQKRVAYSSLIGENFKNVVKELKLDIKHNPRISFMERIGRIFSDPDGDSPTYYKLKDNIEILNDFKERMNSLYSTIETFSFQR